MGEGNIRGIDSGVCMAATTVIFEGMVPAVCGAASKKVVFLLKSLRSLPPSRPTRAGAKLGDKWGKLCYRGFEVHCRGCSSACSVGYTCR